MVEKIGNKIRQLRKLNKMSQEKLAEALGISTQQLHKYETAKNRIPVDKLAVVAKMFQVDLNYFVEIDPVDKVPECHLTSDEEELINIYRKIQSGVFKESLLAIGKELSRCKK